MSPRRRLLPLMLLLLALVVAGCGSDGGDQPDDATPNTPSATRTTDTDADSDGGDESGGGEKPGGGADVEAAVQIDVRASGGTGAPTDTVALACPILDHYAGAELREACRLLGSDPDVVAAPDPAAGACAPVVGAPQTATVKGTLAGEDVDATFTRADSCEVERWDAAAPLFAAAGYTG